MTPMTFRNSKIVYYGPHPCDNCGQLIVKMGHDWGGNAFTNPEGPIYPNTEWHPHVCDPTEVWRHSARAKKDIVLTRFGQETRAIQKSPGGRWVVIDPSGAELYPNEHVRCETELDAFVYVYERLSSSRSQALIDLAAPKDDQKLPEAPA